MTMKWYGVHTYSGYENKVKLNLEERIKSLGAEEFFGEILIPSETVIELKKGERKTSTRKFFPGYILVQMELNNETWHIVKNIPKVTGFVGGGTKPAPISDEEVEKITVRIAEGVEKPKPKVEFEVGETVRVVEGPFVNFTGVVEDVKPEKHEKVAETSEIITKPEEPKQSKEEKPARIDSKKEMGKSTKKKDDKESDFNYIVRIANTDVDGEKKVTHGSP